MNRPDRSSAVAALEGVARATGRRWEVLDLLLGWQEGAWLVAADDGDKAVLKVHPSDRARVVAAAERIERARRQGWPTPAWLEVGGHDEDGAWVLQEHIEGRRPAALDERVADGLIAALEIQRGLGDGDGGGGWGTWVCGVVFEDWDEFRSRVATHFPHGSRLVELVDDIARVLGHADALEGDLVHGNFGVINAVDDGRRVWLVDAASAGPGPVAYDLTEAVFTAAMPGSGPPSGIERLWAWGERHLEPSNIAVCAGSLALTMAEAFHRLDADDEAPLVAAHIIDSLTRARDLVS